MKKYALFAVFFFVSASCMPASVPWLRRTPAPTGAAGIPALAPTWTGREPTPTPTRTAQILTLTPSLTPTENPLLKELVVPTPINTPHVYPTEIGEVSQLDAQDLAQARKKGFESTLKFTIRVTDVKGYTIKGYGYYIVKAAGALTNVSNRPIVTSKTLKAVDCSSDQEVFWRFSYEGVHLYNFCVESYPPARYQTYNYVLLAPGEFQNYAWVFWLPAVLWDSDHQAVPLSEKRIQIVASYVNNQIGFDVTDTRNPYDIYDMNAWVGTVTSAEVEYLFPWQIDLPDPDRGIFYRVDPDGTDNLSAGYFPGSPAVHP